MCGIAGIFAANQGGNPRFQEAVQTMTRALTHRGPDAEGLYYDEHAILGSRRLSIVDLSAAAEQPLTNEDGSLWIVFNGEIYNFQELRAQLKARNHGFRSLSDTEVILHLYEDYGEECLSHLRGMFAFALWDKRRRRLFLARDRSGIKPLYYHPARDFLLFASEVKGVLASGLVPRELNLPAIAGFLALGSVPSPATSLQGIYSVPPGHYLMVEAGRARLKKYWDLRLNSPASCRDEEAVVVRQTSALLAEAARLHLIGDVPVGIFLSGGIDSSALVALASRVAPSRRLKTLSIVFQEAAYSESKYARLVADKYQTDHNETLVRAEDFLRELPRIFQAMDQPSNDGVNTYFVAQAAKAAGLKVVLSGLGGDELFWGYSHYRRLMRLRSYIGLYCKLPGAVRRALLASAVGLGKLSDRGSWAKLKYFNEPSLNQLYLAVRGFFSPDQVQALLPLGDPRWHDRLDHPDDPPEGDLAARFSYLEMKRYLHDQLLRDTDAMSMAHSIEARVPFLDHLLVEYVSQTHPGIKLSPMANKALLIRAMGAMLPEAVVHRPKMGFTFPLSAWMSQHRNPLIEMTLQSPILNPKAVRSIWNSFLRGRTHWSRPWALVALSEWCRSLRSSSC